MRVKYTLFLGHAVSVKVVPVGGAVDGMFAEHRPQEALRRFLAPFQAPALRGGHALAEISIPLEREELLDRSVPDLQYPSEGIFLHRLQRLPFPCCSSNLCFQSFRQFHQRFALDCLLGIDHAHCAASMPGLLR
jgi:hypothetical protein